MKKIYKYGMLLLLTTSMALAISLSTTENGYTNPNDIALNINGELSGNQDWVGIYKPGTSNSWDNVLAWSWVNGKKTNLAIDTIKNQVELDFAGNYEARLFFNNSYALEASTSFYLTNGGLPILLPEPEHKVGDTIKINVNTVLSGNEDWIGLFESGAATTWDNVIAWNWVTSNGIVSLTKGNTNIPEGEYDARLFFNNSFESEASSTFTVKGAGGISTTKETYTSNDTVSVNVNTELSGDHDWVGIFPKDADNSWGNVIAWNWVPNKGTTTLSTKIDNKTMPAGEYEVRLFFHNEYGANATVRARHGFSVGAGNDYVYGSVGDYINEVEYDNTDAEYFVYYPKNHIVNAPLVLVSGYSNVRGYKGLMKYLASQGCYVVGHATRNGEGWSDPSWRINHFKAAVEHAHQLGVDTSRLITMGSSAGGMVSYAVMKYFKAQGYGATKSFVIDIIGYYAPNMTKDDLSKFRSDSLMLYIGTDSGTEDGNFDEDPRTLLTLSKLLNSNMKKSFISLDETKHTYASGSYENVITKHKLLEPIDAMLKYEFFNNNGQYNNAEAILFDNYTETVQRIYDATMVRVGNKEPLQIGYDYPCVNPYLPDGSGNQYDPNVNGFGRPFEPTIDYCNDHGLH